MDKTLQANPAYIASLAGHVLALWFVRVPIDHRASFVSYLVNELHTIREPDPPRALAREALVLLQVINQYTYTSRVSAYSQQLAPGVEMLFCRNGVDVSQHRVWLQGSTLIAIRSGPRGWAHVRLRNSVGTAGWLTRPSTRSSAHLAQAERAMVAWLSTMMLPSAALPPPDALATEAAGGSGRRAQGKAGHGPLDADTGGTMAGGGNVTNAGVPTANANANTAVRSVSGDGSTARSDVTVTSSDDEAEPETETGYSRSMLGESLSRSPSTLLLASSPGRAHVLAETEDGQLASPARATRLHKATMSISTQTVSSPLLTPNLPGLNNWQVGTAPTSSRPLDFAPWDIFPREQDETSVADGSLGRRIFGNRSSPEGSGAFGGLQGRPWRGQSSSALSAPPSPPTPLRRRMNSIGDEEEEEDDGPELEDEPELSTLPESLDAASGPDGDDTAMLALGEAGTSAEVLADSTATAARTASAARAKTTSRTAATTTALTAAVQQGSAGVLAGSQSHDQLPQRMNLLSRQRSLSASPQRSKRRRGRWVARMSQASPMDYLPLDSAEAQSQSALGSAVMAATAEFGPSSASLLEEPRALRANSVSAMVLRDSDDTLTTLAARTTAQRHLHAGAAADADAATAFGSALKMRGVGKVEEN